jgi:hypothetical protein
MRCHDAQRAIRSEALGPPSSAPNPELHEHLAACPACASLRRAETRLTDLLRQSSPPTPSRSVHRAIDQAVRQTRPARASWLTPAGAATAVVAALVLVAPLAWRGVTRPAATVPARVAEFSPDDLSPSETLPVAAPRAQVPPSSPDTAVVGAAAPRKASQRAASRRVAANAGVRGGSAVPAAARVTVSSMDTRALEEALRLPEVDVCLDVRSADCSFDIAAAEAAARVHSLPVASRIVGGGGPEPVSSISPTEVASP